MVQHTSPEQSFRSNDSDQLRAEWTSAWSLFKGQCPHGQRQLAPVSYGGRLGRVRSPARRQPDPGTPSPIPGRRLALPRAWPGPTSSCSRPIGRDTDRHGWTAPNATQLSLRPLAAADSLAVVRSLLPDVPDAGELRAADDPVG